MDESTCIVDMALYFINFAQNESCGNCTPCRIGTRVLKSTLEKIVRGEGEIGDLEMMQRVANTMVKTSLCGLGQAASNPVTSSLRYFYDEYEEHISGKYCPAAVCPDIFEYYISPERCSGCGLCVSVCRVDAIQGKRKETHTLDISKCIKCRSCVNICTRKAIIGIRIDDIVESEAVL